MSFSNWDGFDPPSAMEVRFAVAVPEFLTVIVCATLLVPSMVLGKVSEVALRVIAGAVPDAPVPVIEAVCEPVPALSETLSVAELVPATVGLKVMVTVHVPDAARLALHVLVCENEVGLVPVMVMLVMLAEAVPVFFTVTASVVASVAPTVVVPGKLTEVGVSVMAGAEVPAL